jgi:hypothetical protein
MGMPLGPGAAADLCAYCTDVNWKLKPYAQVRAGIAPWLSSWAPKTGTADFENRAERSMKAMPAWAAHEGSP